MTTSEESVVENSEKRKRREFSEEELERYAIDFNTSSAVSKMHLKILALYVPILWLGGMLTITAFFGILLHVPDWLVIVLLPVILFGMWFVFIFGCILVSKLFLVLIELIHRPRQGIFLAQEGDKDFEFWRLRTEVKKLGVWLLNNCPLPWADTWAFRWFGVKMDFSSHLMDAWVDVEFIKMGRKVTIGQGAVVMSSMVVGKYLIIKEVLLDDYVVVGGVSTIAPGTIIGRDSVIGAFSTTNYKQLLEQGWIYFGIPGIKLKENKFAEERRDIIVKRDVDSEEKYETIHDVNIDEDKKHMVKEDSGGES